MAPVRFEPDAAAKFDAVKFGQIQPPGYLKSAFYWVIDSDYRAARDVSKWMLPQIITPGTYTLSFAQPFVDMKPDAAVRAIYLSLRSKSTYKDEVARWQKLEYWLECEQLLKWLEGDCEDVANAIVVIGRIAGIPAHRLPLAVVEVVDPSDETKTLLHAVAVYRPTEYPACWCIMDWCFHPDDRKIGERDLYEFAGKKIIRWELGANGWQQKKSKYLRVLALIDENSAYVPNIFSEW